MGCYINPKGMSKEVFLEKNKIKEFDNIPKSFPENEEEVLVCLVDNGPFTAAAVCYCKSEFKAFSDPTDPRPVRWFLVPKSKILEANPENSRYFD